MTGIWLLGILAAVMIFAVLQPRVKPQKKKVRVKRRKWINGLGE